MPAVRNNLLLNVVASSEDERRGKALSSLLDSCENIVRGRLVLSEFEGGSLCENLLKKLLRNGA
jgi:hypothetical protein